MTDEKTIQDLLAQDAALLEGHFKLRSGLHSSRYLQCARLYQYPEHSELISRRLASLIGDVSVDAVVGPATGGIVGAYELARVLSCRGIFAERVDSTFALRRGFEVASGEKVVVAEDVITTGGAVMQVIELLRSLGADVLAVAAVINRSGTNPFDVPFHYLVGLDVPTWKAEDCPLCLKGEPIYKPGSSKEAK
jgi:orotate phosphoribosyltransferase